MNAYHKIRTAGMTVRFAFRFCAGRNLFSERRTNATFLRRGTFSTDPTKTTPTWEFLPGWQRFVWRLAGLYLVSVLLISALLSPLEFSGVSVPWYLRSSVIAETHLLAVSVSVSAYLLRRRIISRGLRLPLLVRETPETETVEGEILEPEIVPTEMGRRRLRLVEVVEGRREWEKEVILPIGYALAAQLGIPRTDREIRRLISVPRDFHSGGVAEIHLPETFTGADLNAEKRIVKTIQSRLGMREKDDISVSWVLGGSDPLLRFHLPEKLPTLVTFSDVRRYLEAMEEWDFLYGVVSGGEVFSVSVSGDTPHGAISAGSGAGKSELLKNKIAQQGHKGWFVIILDWKDESHEWAKGLRGVRYVSAIEKIHDTLVALGDEVDFRKSLGSNVPKIRTAVILEEWQVTAPLLADYWSMLRSTADPEERRTMPLRSPALTAMMKLTFCGRSLGLFVELVAIRFSTRVTNGNGDLRESFQVINMARWKPQTVKMLAPGVKPFPKKPKERGRWVGTDGETAVLYQAPLWTNDEAKEWFTSGIECPMSPWMLHGDVARLTVDTQRITQEDQLGDRLTPPNQPPAIEAKIIDARKLSEMAESLAPLGVTLEILRHAAKEDEQFPDIIGGTPNRGYTYDYAEVRNWARKRFSVYAAGGKR